MENGKSFTQLSFDGKFELLSMKVDEFMIRGGHWEKFKIEYWGKSKLSFDGKFSAA